MAGIEFPRIGRGERVIVAGRTGSGKSTLGDWLLRRSVGHWVILNPKWTKSYSKLPGSITVKVKKPDDWEKIVRAIMEWRYVIVEPHGAATDPAALDALVEWLHDNYRDIGLCVDELYSVHINGRAGAGLIGWLTRGRELTQSFLGLTQRPAWVSQFLFSEADYIAGMALNLKKDRARMVEMTGQQEFDAPLPPHYWLWYDVADNLLRSFAPVPLPIDIKQK
jgi:hypothetical protein